MRDQNALRRLLSGSLLVVLITEWLRPLTELSNWTDVYAIEPILITIIGVLAVDVLRITPVWTWIVKLLIILSSVAAMFHGTNLFHLDWWVNFTILIMQDFLRILTGQWDAVSAEGRTLLFIGAWATVVCWLYVVILYQRIALYVTMLTIVYLLVLQLWMGLDTIKGVVLVVIVGLSLHGLSVLPVLENKFGLSNKSPGWPMSWVISSILLVCITVGCGFIVSVGQDRAALKLPHMKPLNWKSIEAFSPFSLQSFPGYSNEHAEIEQKSGYSMDDTKLGGTVKSDDSIAFLANTEQPQAYWRGESKAVYDGKGWSNLTNDLFGYEIGAELPDVLTDLNSNSSRQNKSSFVQEVFPFPDYPHDDRSTILLSGGAIQRVDGVAFKEGASSSAGLITLDRIEGKYMLLESGSSTLTTYRLQSSVPITSEDAEKRSASEEPIPAVISAAYVQLPEQLPERINQLTHYITDEFNSTWEKANAIDQFLGEHYRYTLTPKLSAKEGDFVDQFLFEQKEGYCDYFSTAMTVMLRTIGIPARWVKGFTPGEIIDVEENGFLQESSLRLRSSQIVTFPVMVRNRNAHSWVEVYISGVGWTAFDPTPQSLVAESQGTGAEVASSSDEEEGSHLLHKFIVGTLTVMSDKRTLTALLWAAAIVLSGQTARMVFRSRSIRHSWLTIHIRFLMMKYAWGMTTNDADTRLLERVLSQTFSRYGHGIHRGETLQESVRRGYFPDEVVVRLLELISLYELARYGPVLRKRIPYRTIAGSWRLLR
ncbi:MAG: transglutaminase-like domain-containing protein [Paenibacillaceae bacterium]